MQGLLNRSGYSSMKPLVAMLALCTFILLGGCESTAPAAGAQAGPQAASKTATKPRCEKREVTGSRLARCDDGEVKVITGEEIQNSGMPVGGAGRGAEGR
jgi:hypothetical protein